MAIDDNTVMLLSAVPIPLSASAWLIAPKGRMVVRIALAGIATSASLPIGLWIVGLYVNLPPGEHSPGVGLVFFPVIAVWVTCMAAWPIVAVLLWLLHNYRKPVSPPVETSQFE